jgi:hypothetical protein
MRTPIHRVVVMFLLLVALLAAPTLGPLGDGSPTPRDAASADAGLAAPPGPAASALTPATAPVTTASPVVIVPVVREVCLPAAGRPSPAVARAMPFVRFAPSVLRV